jgi:hypothetical protein
LPEDIMTDLHKINIFSKDIPENTFKDFMKFLFYYHAPQDLKFTWRFKTNFVIDNVEKGHE